MNWNELAKVARAKFAGSCRVCPVCDGVACAGAVPGMGGVGTGASFRNNAAVLAGFKLNMRTIHEVAEPDLTCRILGMELAMPVLAAPIGGIDLNMNKAMPEADYARAVVSGCRQAGAIGMTGDGPLPEVFAGGLAALQAEGGRAIPVIKPRQKEKVVELAKQAADAGAPAFGMDIDAAALLNMTRNGQPVGPKTAKDLEFIKRNTPIPFIVKGIMTADEARTCYEAGADALVVSNHGGRSLDHTPATAEVLPFIAEEVKGKLTIFADGGVRGGTDVLKMLALGADAVLVGRPVAVAAVGGGAEGVALLLRNMAAELRMAMILTGTPCLDEVGEDIIW